MSGGGFIMKKNTLKNAGMSDIKKRFIEIISEHTQPWWAEKLKVSQGVISSSWVKGNLPRTETLFRIIKIKGISPNWFFFGIKPRYLNDVDGIEGNENEQGRETYLKMLRQESENRELRQKIDSLENSLRMQSLSKLVSLTPGDVNISKVDLFKNHGIAFVTLMRLLNDIMFKSFELLLSNQIDEKGFEKILAWINDNFEPSKFKTIADLKSLEGIIPPK